MSASKRAIPKPKIETAGGGQPDRGGLVAEYGGAEVAEERRGLAVEIGDEQVGEQVAVEVSAGCPHPRLEGTFGVAGDTAGCSGLFKLHAAQVMPEVIGRRVVGDEKIDPSVRVDVRRDDTQATPVSIDDARFGSHIHEPASVVAEEMIGQGVEKARRAIVVYLAGLDSLARGRHCLPIAEFRMLGVPDEVMTDVKVEVAVVVEVSEGGRGRPVAITSQAGLSR